MTAEKTRYETLYAKYSTIPIIAGLLKDDRYSDFAHNLLDRLIRYTDSPRIITEGFNESGLHSGTNGKTKYPFLSTTDCSSAGLLIRGFYGRTEPAKADYLSVFKTENFEGEGYLAEYLLELPFCERCEVEPFLSVNYVTYTEPLEYKYHPHAEKPYTEVYKPTERYNYTIEGGLNRDEFLDAVDDFLS